MECLYCTGKTRVTNTRHQIRTGSVWRRRTCLECQAVFTSVETPSLEKSIVVQYARSKTKPFDRQRLFISLYESCRHRKTAVADAEGLTRTVISKLLPEVIAASLPKATITSTSLGVLKNFDTAAATYYAAFHPNSK